MAGAKKGSGLAMLLGGSSKGDPADETIDISTEPAEDKGPSASFKSAADDAWDAIKADDKEAFAAALHAAVSLHGYDDEEEEVTGEHP